MEIEVRQRPKHAQQVHDALLKIQEVQTQASISKAQIYKLIGLRLFPQPIRCGSKFTRWHASAINAWIADPIGWAERNTANEGSANV